MSSVAGRSTGCQPPAAGVGIGGGCGRSGGRPGDRRHQQWHDDGHCQEDGPERTVGATVTRLHVVALQGDRVRGPFAARRAWAPRHASPVTISARGGSAASAARTIVEAPGAPRHAAASPAMSVDGGQGGTSRTLHPSSHPQEGPRPCAPAPPRSPPPRRRRPAAARRPGRRPGASPHPAAGASRSRCSTTTTASRRCCRSRTAWATTSTPLAVGGVAAYASPCWTARSRGAESAGHSVVNVYAGDVVPRLRHARLQPAARSPRTRRIYDAVAQRLMPYDVHVFGNHEFDYGPDLLRSVRDARSTPGTADPALPVGQPRLQGQGGVAPSCWSRTASSIGAQGRPGRRPIGDRLRPRDRRAVRHRERHHPGAAHDLLAPQGDRDARTSRRPRRRSRRRSTGWTRRASTRSSSSATSRTSTTTRSSSGC